MAIGQIALPRRHGIQVKRRALTLLFPAILASGVGLTLLTPEARSVALPTLVLANLALCFLVVLWKRDRILPIFELGTISTVATTVYSIIPLVGFWFAGLRWTSLSDSRLDAYAMVAEEVGGFAWRHVLYLASFAVSYLYVRGRGFAWQNSFRIPDRTTTTAVVVLFLTLSAFTQTVYAVFDESSLPYSMKQVSHNAFAILFILKQWVLVLLMQRWQSRKWRVILILWLLAEAVATIRFIEGRTEMVMLMLSVALLYHRLVKPLTLPVAALVGGAGLIGILLYGFARDIGGGLATTLAGETTPWATMNEFQSLFGTAYDLYVRKSRGSLENIPWQLYVSDLYMLIPSQLLPFYKWDPSEWYLDLIGARGIGYGAMFGVVSQAIIGLDWVELALRGAMVGWLFALIHRWYVRRQSRLWATLLYLFVCTWSYYTFRATSFYILYYVVYRFLPAVLLVLATRALLKSARRPQAAAM